MKTKHDPEYGDRVEIGGDTGEVIGAFYDGLKSDDHRDYLTIEINPWSGPDEDGGLPRHYQSRVIRLVREHHDADWAHEGDDPDEAPVKVYVTS